MCKKILKILKKILKLKSININMLIVFQPKKQDIKRNRIKTQVKQTFKNEHYKTDTR